MAMDMTRHCRRWAARIVALDACESRLTWLRVAKKTSARDSGGVWMEHSAAQMVCTNCSSKYITGILDLPDAGYNKCFAWCIPKLP